MEKHWVSREQKLLRRKIQKAQRKFFNEPQATKKKKTKRYPRERDYDNSDQQMDDDDDIF